MAGGKGGASLRRGGGPDPGGWLHWDRPLGRMGPGGEAQFLHDVKVMWILHVPALAQGPLWGEEGLSTPRGPAEAARGPRGVTLVLQTPQGIASSCAHTSPTHHAGLHWKPAPAPPPLPRPPRPGDRGLAGSHQALPPSFLPEGCPGGAAPTLPQRAAPHTLAAPRGPASSAPLPPQANESHPISVPSCKNFFFPLPGAEPSLEGLWAAGTAQPSRAALGLCSWDGAGVASFLLPFQFSTSPVPSLGPFWGYVHRDVYLHVL